MVGGAARAALSAAILTLACFCVLGAQGEVTLAGANAEKSGESLAIDFKTSDPASFRIDRFTTGDWVFVWSPRFSAPTSEQAVDVDLSEAGGLVHKVTQSQDGKRSGIRIYLGKNVDRQDVFLVSTKQGTRVFIPPAKPKVGNPVGQVTASGKGSGTVPVADYGGAGILDYQLSPVMPPTTADSDEENETPADRAAEATAPENAPERLSEPMPPYEPPKPSRPKSAAPTGGISTPDGMVDSTLAAATLSMSGPAGLTASSKDALNDVWIELFEIVNEPLDQALQLLVSPTDFNIIVDASVGDNTVSLSFKDGQTSLRSALDLLARTYKLEYIVESNTIVVAAQDKVYPNLIQYEARLFVLSYADPLSVRNMLITTGVVAETQIEHYMGETEYPQVNGSTVLSTTSGDDDTDIVPIETNLSTSPRNAILVRGTPDLLAYVAQVIGQLDRKPQQIQLEVRVCELNDAAIKHLGLRTDASFSQVFSEVGLAANPDDDPIFEANQLGSFTRSGGFSFEAVLDAEINNGNVRVLSQPVITTTDGKQAIWFAGDRVPYIAEPAVSTGQNFQAAKVKFINVGVMLSFKPRLDRDGLITIDANPSISSLIEFLDLGSGATAPQTQNRQLRTTIRVHDGQSFSLAGLITETERTTTIKTPLLGDIPLIGNLFRNKRKERERTEIVIIVTPKIVE